jgi:hypothetical protein
MTAMRASRGLVALLIGLVVFTPFAYASTYETWTEGLYDAESDGNVLEVICSQIVDTTPVFTSRGCVDVAVGVVSPLDDRAADLAVPSPRSARAPPTS